MESNNAPVAEGVVWVCGAEPFPGAAAVDLTDVDLADKALFLLETVLPGVRRGVRTPSSISSLLWLTFTRVEDFFGPGSLQDGKTGVETTLLVLSSPPTRTEVALDVAADTTSDATE